MRNKKLLCSDLETSLKGLNLQRKITSPSTLSTPSTADKLAKSSVNNINLTEESPNSECREFFDIDSGLQHSPDKLTKGDISEGVEYKTGGVGRNIKKLRNDVRRFQKEVSQRKSEHSKFEKEINCALPISTEVIMD